MPSICREAPVERASEEAVLRSKLEVTGRFELLAIGLRNQPKCDQSGDGAKWYDHLAYALTVSLPEFVRPTGQKAAVTRIVGPDRGSVA